jgi:hypothetical protein
MSQNRHKCANIDGCNLKMSKSRNFDRRRNFSGQMADIATQTNFPKWRHLMNRLASTASCITRDTKSLSDNH